ncbi:unnamed protein product [Effrenium voratum]|nr:unnamed protein product [Effrenium voratum]
MLVGAAAGWQESGRGPRLRQLFGNYRGQDIWAILRKMKSTDDGQGFLGFEEVQELLCLKAPSMLFLWDIFSQQNELFAAKELLTVACVFSSALLEEKARFLHAVFDLSGRGLGTGSEVASICLMVLSVLGKVTGAMAKAKEVTPQLMIELEQLVPPYARLPYDVLQGAMLFFVANEGLGYESASHPRQLLGSLRVRAMVSARIEESPEMQKKAQEVLGKVMQKVSRVLNERVSQEQGGGLPDDDEACIMFDSFALGRQFPEVDIDPRLVFDNPTIEQLSQAILEAPKAQRTRSVESASTKEPGAANSAPFTQLTDVAGAEARCEYHAQEAADLFRRSTDGVQSRLLPACRAQIGDDTFASSRENEGPSHYVELSSFLMDVEPVSIAAYARFLNLTTPTQEELFDWCLLPVDDPRCCHVPLIEGPEGWQVKPGVPPNWPMILVSWWGANAYSLWAHGEDCHSYKSTAKSFLPTEAQWEYAARGPETKQFPWGDEEATPELLNVNWDATAYDSKGNVAAHVAAPLEELPLCGVNTLLGMSPFGLRGMAGNVWQWCRDTYHTNFYMSSEATQPDAWNCEEEEGTLKSERGGSWVGPASLARSSYRRGRHPGAKGRCLGFRCCGPGRLVESRVAL